MPNGLKFTLKGDLAMGRKLTSMAKNAPLAFAFAAYEEMLIEREEAAARTPVDTGDLRDSLTVSEPEIGKTILIFIYTNVEYAPIVHEDLEAFHAVGEAKFIESTLRESQPHMAERIGRRIDLGQLVRTS